MLTRMPDWFGRAATLKDGRRVGAMRLPDDFAFHVPDIYDPATGACVAHGGTVAGPAGAHVVCDAGYFFAVGRIEMTPDGRRVPADLDAVTYDDEAVAALVAAGKPADAEALRAHFASHPVDADDLVAQEA